MIWPNGACMGQKISAKQLKTGEGGDSSCANALWGMVGAQKRWLSWVFLVSASDSRL